MRIVVDAMGGDHAPAVEVQGAVEAVRGGESVDITLVGDEARVRAELERQGAARDGRLRVVHAPERIEMGEDPVPQVRRKKNASITVATRLLKEGQAEIKHRKTGQRETLPIGDAVARLKSLIEPQRRDAI